jgi:hypothetical protein
VDAAGNVYVADSGNQRVELVPNPLAAFPSNTPQSTVVAGLASSTAVTVTPGGNLVLTDNATVYYVNRTTHLPTLSFPGTVSGASSPPKTLTLSDVGNQELDVTGGSFDPDFPPTSSDYCVDPVEPGGQCSVSIVFSPQGGALGTRTGTWTIADNAITGGGTQMFSVTGPAWLAQSITFTTNAPTSAGGGKTFQVEAQANPSRGAVSFSSAGVCKNSATTLVDPVNSIYASTYTMTSGTATCSVIAKAPALPQDNYAAGSATALVIASRYAQSITFAQPPNQPLSAETYSLTATASSGLAVSFTSRTAAVCTVSGNTVTLLTTGTCSLQAAQPGNNNWLTAKPVTRSFQITP